jgi:alkylhydroperoxidase family enzyme
VPWLEPEDITDREAGIYPQGRPAANIMKAMSLVPDEVRSFFDIVSHQYQGPLEMRDFAREYRAISHAQIELLAARVSALNQCLY